MILRQHLHKMSDLVRSKLGITRTLGGAGGGRGAGYRAAAKRDVMITSGEAFDL